MVMVMVMVMVMSMGMGMGNACHSVVQIPHCFGAHRVLRPVNLSHPEFGALMTPGGRGRHGRSR